jgi:hypothetical protein
MGATHVGALADHQCTAQGAVAGMCSQVGAKRMETGRTLSGSSKAQPLFETRSLAFAAAGCAGLLLAGCIVVPLGPDGRVPAVIVPAGAGTAAPLVATGPAPITVPVRLYPTNEIAAGLGPIAGSVTNQLTGKGTFTLNVGGEMMSGEATRTGGTRSNTGVASAYGARGGYANCDYTMNSTSQGSGRCVFSNGAQYQLHIGG